MDNINSLNKIFYLTPSWANPPILNIGDTNEYNERCIGVDWNSLGYWEYLIGKKDSANAPIWIAGNFLRGDYKPTRQELIDEFKIGDIITFKWIYTQNLSMIKGKVFCNDYLLYSFNLNRNGVTYPIWARYKDICLSELLL